MPVPTRRTWRRLLAPPLAAAALAVVAAPAGAVTLSPLSTPAGFQARAGGRGDDGERGRRERWGEQAAPRAARRNGHEKRLKGH